MNADAGRPAAPTQEATPVGGMTLGAGKDWDAVIIALCKAQGFAEDDDLAMLTAEDDDLTGWVDDLEARIGLNVVEMRPAVLDFIASRNTDGDERSNGRAAT